MQSPGPLRWRFILRETRSAAENMAIDEMLLRRGEGATVRFYQFTRPSVTLGYDQDTAIAKRGTILAEDIIRRPTGGNAVYHGTQDLTYSVCAPLSAFGKGQDLRHVYDVVRSWIIKGLNCIDGVVASCHGKNDIIASDGKKICGNAIRIDRANSYVLVHGSIFVNSTAEEWAEALDIPLTTLKDKLGRIADYAEVPPLMQQVSPALLSAFCHNEVVTGFVTGTYSAQELEHVHRLMTQRYANPAWLSDGRKTGTACAADIQDD